MPDCESITPLITPYVDGELAGALRASVDLHLQGCPACRSLVVTERAVRTLLKTQQSELCADRAPLTLHGRCAALRPGTRTGGEATRFGTMPRLAAAAVLLAVVGGALFAATSRSPRLMAAELAADHVKCVALNAVLRTHRSMADVHRSLASSVGDAPELPGVPGRDDFELVGERPCLYGEGRVAHVMYRHQGRDVSLFILPRKQVEAARLTVLGHTADMWSVGDRTFVLVTRGDAQDIERTASILHAALR